MNPDGSGLTQVTDDTWYEFSASWQPILDGRASQTITVTQGAPASAGFNTSFTVAATASSGLPVTIGTSGACSISGNTVTMTSATGICTVTFDQAGDANSLPAPQVVQTTTAQKAGQTITVTQGAPATAAFGTSFTVAATASSGLPVTIAASGACSLSGATVTMTSGTGTCTVTFDQAGNASYLPAPQVVQTTTAQKASQTITVTQAAPSTAEVGASFPVSATASSGLLVTIGVSGSCSLSGSTVTMTSGTGVCTMTFSQAGNADYLAAPQVMQITRAPSVPPTGPDLVATSVSKPPVSAIPGSGFSVTDTVKNQGSATAGHSKTHYFLSLDVIRDSADVRLTGKRPMASLIAGATSTGTVTVTIPARMPFGMYFLLVCADDGTRVTEADETNNCLAAASKIQILGPDLAAVAVSNPPASAIPGSNFGVTDTVRNQGGAIAGGSRTHYYLSLDAVRGDMRLTGKRQVPSLGVGATSTGTTTVHIEKGTPAGSYFLLACADDFDAVRETDETNNCLASATRVVVGP